MAIDQSEIQKKLKLKQALLGNEADNATPPPLPQPGALPPPPPMPAPLTLTPPQPDTAEAPRPFDAVAQMFPVAPKQQVAADVTNSPQAAYDKAKADSTARRAGSLDSDSWRTFMGGISANQNQRSFSATSAAADRSVAGAQAEEAKLQGIRSLSEQLGVKRDVGMAQANAAAQGAKVKQEGAERVARIKASSGETIAQTRAGASKYAADARLDAALGVQGMKSEDRDAAITAHKEEFDANLAFLKEMKPAELDSKERQKWHSDLTKELLFLPALFPDPKERAKKSKEINDTLTQLRNPQGAAAAPSAPAAKQLPKVGEVLKGYRFKGGDPAKPESWEKV